MYLKTLTIRGFKSFASATTLRLEPGITCIVGPNGSGKSNIVDALTWVMGEQGAKSLRGANMADVIFAGTAERPALGRAQVELTIDNSDGRLPIEYAEVTIARTLFRGGNSEYTINGAQVRLLDVQELLSDTGMGKQMHVIVGQGQLDAVLRASPMERREFIDEAAGVLKHRRRKERTLRKLGAMDADLLRVVDLTEEIRRQLKPLARQAKAARAAEGVHHRIREAQLRLNVDEYLQATAQLSRDEKQVSQLRESWTGHEERVRELDKQLRELDDVAALHSRKLGEITEIAHQFDSLQERLSSSAALAGERIAQEQSGPVAVSEAAVQLAADKLAEVLGEAAQIAEATRVAEIAVSSAEKHRSDAEAKQRSVAGTVRELEVAVEQRRKQFMDLREKELRAQASLAAAREAVQDAQNRFRDAEQLLAQLEGRVEVSADNDPEQTYAEEQRAQYQEAERAAHLARETLEEVRASQHEAAADFARWQARAEALQQTLNAAYAGGEESFGEPLGKYLRVTRGLEVAVSALLRDFEGAIIEPNRRELVQTIALGEAAPRALIVADPSAGLGSFGDVPLPPTADLPGPVLRYVANVPGVTTAVRELFAGAWVAGDMEQAEAALRNNPEVTRVVTLTGVVLGRHSALNTAGAAPSALELRSQWEEALAGAETSGSKLRDVETAVMKAREQVSESAHEAGKVLKSLRTAEQEWARSQQQRKEWTRQVLSAKSERDRLLLELEARERKLEVAMKEAAEAEAAIATADGEEAAVPESYRAELALLDNQLVGLRDAELSAKLALSAAQEKERSSARQVAAFRARHEQLRDDRTEGLRRDQQRADRLTKLRSILSRVSAARDEALVRGQEAVLHRETLGRQAEELTQHRSRTAEKLERLRWEQVSTSEQRQQAEVAIAGAKLRRDRAEEELADLLRDPHRMEEERSIVPEDLWDETIRAYHPDQPMVDESGEPIAYSREAVSTRLREAQRELQRLGVVNPLAVTEYEALEARYKFLQDQVGDLRQSKRDLLEIIADVDLRIQTAFEEAFADTQHKFTEVFASLFPGGTGKLSLTDPDNPLETGVEIYARPAGKRVTRLSLLSGGERSLAALAYLVAIFRARPSPFYVMDEVEAALDDINLSRVLGVMEQLREDSQLIMVTHQKRTMEIADALYGVSMREGTTRVVSHRM